MTYAIYQVKTVMRKLTFLDSDFNENDVILRQYDVIYHFSQTVGKTIQNKPFCINF